MKDLNAGFAYVQLIAPQAAISADTVSAAFALSPYIRAALVVNVGASAATLTSTNKIELEVQDTVDGTTWLPAANTDVVGAVSGATSNTGTIGIIQSNPDLNKTYKCAYIGNKLAARVVANFSGTHAGGTFISAFGVGELELAQ
jgi:hypothetical protein